MMSARRTTAYIGGAANTEHEQNVAREKTN